MPPVLIDSHRPLPMDVTYKEARKFRRHQLSGSLRNGRGQWWIWKCKKTEKATAIGNGRNYYQLIRSTDPRKSGVSEMNQSFQ